MTSASIHGASEDLRYLWLMSIPIRLTFPWQPMTTSSLEELKWILNKLLIFVRKKPTRHFPFEFRAAKDRFSCYQLWRPPHHCTNIEEINATLTRTGTLFRLDWRDLIKLKIRLINSCVNSRSWFSVQSCLTDSLRRVAFAVIFFARRPILLNLESAVVNTHVNVLAQSYVLFLDACA